MSKQQQFYGDDQAGYETQSLMGKSPHGSPLRHDPAFTGMKPSHHRACHDVPFCILFLLMFAGMAGIAAFGIYKGDPAALVPQVVDSAAKYGKPEAQASLQDMIAEIKTQYVALVGATAMAIVLGFIWIQLLKFFTKAFIYITLFMGVALVLGCGAYLYFTGQANHDKNVVYASYAFGGVGVLLIAVIIFLRSRINLTAVLMRETVVGINHNSPSVFIVAISVVLAFVGYSAFWAVQLVYLYSVPSGAVPAHVTQETQISFNTGIRYAMLYQVFAFFWITSFISGVYQFVVAGSVSSWYFGRTAYAAENAIGRFGAPYRALALALTKSFGSIALATLILAIVKFVNFLLERAKKHQTNKAVKYIICCLQCLVYCCQSVISFINKFAFIAMAMHGESFCTSARTVSGLIGRNALSLIVVDLFGDFVLFVGKLFGTAAATVLTVVVLNATHHSVSPVILVLCVIISFVVFHLYAHIVGTGLDTVFVCYLEDLERNSENGRFVISDATHQYIQNHHQSRFGKSVNADSPK